MTSDISTPEMKPEPMPALLLAELFSSGIVVIPEEFQVKTGQGAAAQTTAKTIPENPGSVPSTSAGSLPGVVELPVSDELTWLGNFGRKVLVVVKDPTALHINETDYELLAKILGSVKLSLADIALVNAETHSLEYYALNEKLPAATALYFGIQPFEIGAPIKFPAFQVQNWNHTTFIYSPSLGELNAATPAATALKKELWTALKKIFG